MDPLSNIISLLKPHDCVAAGFDAGGDWAVRFNRHDGLKCNAVVRGGCWLRVEDVEERIWLDAGDCFILTKGSPFLISAHPAEFGGPNETIYAPLRHGGTGIYGTGGSFFMTGSRFLLSGPTSQILLGSLPPVILLRQSSSQDAVQWSLHRIAEELREPRPGAAISIAHLSHFVLVQVMRAHLASALPATNGWMAALTDGPISKAVAAMHDDPARAWTVGELASLAHLSRTSFAVRFRRVAGQTPIEYLTEWRMLLAAETLSRTGKPVAHVAAEVGYTSESAFTVAFKRAMGRTPRRYAVEVEDALSDVV